VAVIVTVSRLSVLAGDVADLAAGADADASGAAAVWAMTDVAPVKSRPRAQWVTGRGARGCGNGAFILTPLLKMCQVPRFSTLSKSVETTKTTT
jgi:hypothetical protein